MNKELYIAKKILPHKDKANISKPIVNIAIFAIALGLAVMIVAVSIIFGFKSTISEKIFGFSSHMQIVNFDSNISFESIPITKDTFLLSNLKSNSIVEHCNVYATKPAIVKANNTVKGVVVKGIDKHYSNDFFAKHIIEGKAISITDSITNNVIISKTLAKLLQLEVGSSFITTFVPNERGKLPRKRRFVVSGIYETNLQEIDGRFIIADIRHIQKLNNWTEDEISGYEVFLFDYKTIDTDVQIIQDEVGYDITPEAQRLKVQSLKQINPQIFDWLNLLDMNAWVIIILMVLVAGMNMITGLLVIILEKTNSIGIFKTLGFSNISIQKVFMYVGGLLIFKGLFWGNVIGIGLCLIQMYFHIIPLDPSTYFMPYVPIKFSVIGILLLNMGTLVITILMLLLPALIISKISPSEAVSFE